MGLSGSDSSGIAFESYPEKGSQEKSTASDLYAEFYFGDCALRYDPYAFITSRPYEQTAWNQYQLDDHAICIPYYLYCKRNLAGSRMGIDHVTAALSNTSKDLEEAALMDGANLLQQIWYVELPAIKDIIVIQFILQAGNIMSIGFEKAYALQTDMNLPASEIISTYVYRIGLLNGDYGYSTAVGLFNSVVNVILLVFVNWVVKKLNDGEGL